MEDGVVGLRKSRIQGSSGSTKQKDGTQTSHSKSRPIGTWLLGVPVVWVTTITSQRTASKHSCYSRCRGRNYTEVTH